MNILNKQKLLTVVCSLLITSLFSQTFPYTNTIFPASVKTADIVYGTAPFLNAPYINESNTSTGNLVMDIYTPQGDNNTNRPAIIFAHSGGFALGDRNHDDMVAFCDSMARKGYVTATIDYRKGFYALSNTAMHSTRAVYRGLQDGRAAVRFLRANASTYGIDPNKVYLAGSSAGSFIALHSIYMDQVAEKPTDAGSVNYSNFIFPFSYSGPDLGAYDIGDNLSFSGEPDAILAMWGAIESTDLITRSNNEPVFLVHGSDDVIVPFNSGPPFSIPTFPDVDGSNLINGKLDMLNLTNKQTYFVNGEGHEFHGASNGAWINGVGGNAHWDNIVAQATDFFWQQHKPTADFNFTTNDLIANFSDNSMGAISWAWDFGDGNTSQAQNPIHTYTGYGNYQVRLYIENSNLSWDTFATAITLLAPLPVVWSSPIQAVINDKDAVISWTVSTQFNNEKFILEHSLDGRYFSPITTINGAGNSNLEMTYHYVHQNISAGQNYYRVAQVDYDGAMRYSNVSVVQLNDQGSSFSVYPNPASNMVTVEFSNKQPEFIAVYNSMGKLMISYPISNLKEELDLSVLAPGIYFLKANDSIRLEGSFIKK